MAFLNENERDFLQAVSRLAYCNPFFPERIRYEKEALGSEFREQEPVWSMKVTAPDAPRANLVNITARLEPLCEKLRGQLETGVSVTDQGLELYEIGALFLLYRRYEDRFYAAIVEQLERPTEQVRLESYTAFARDWHYFFHLPPVIKSVKHDAAHLFASFFQLRRAFHFIFRYIIGTSMVVAQLRAATWESIFTHDIRRYRETLYDRLGDFTTLITGPSGTGKELVARAIGLSRYIPFDAARRTFAANFSSLFHALNLAALPSTLIESELFGHRRGAFTGALQDQRGWLEVCEPWGTVFLDEVGDLDPAVQVKLLRVLQTRTFQPLGDTKEKLFHGKIIAATNQDLAATMETGRIRADFYYRLCADMIVTPSLQEQLHESPQVLREIIFFIAQALAGPEAEPLTNEVEAWIRKHLGEDYPWPGNIRELEQCVRSILIRKEYHAPRRRSQSVREALVASIVEGTLDAEEILSRYCTLVYAQTGSYEETARRVKLDRRTVKKKVDSHLLAHLAKG